MTTTLVLPEPQVKKTSVFFPNLNGLRFVAAALVIIHHLELTKSQFGIKHISNNLFISSVGGIGVTLFFVLSGFLITYLLLVEKEKHQSISLSRFYLRRILRIWPLYYLIVILAFFVIPHISFFSVPGLSNTLSDQYSLKLVLYILFLPNVASAALSTIPYAGQSWSIGVEEQFYLIWPILINKTNRYVEAFIVIAVVMILLSGGLVGSAMVTWGHLMHWENSGWYHAADVTTQFFKDLRIGCMAIGGLGAYILYYNKKSLLNLIFAKQTQIFILVVLGIMLLRGFVITHEFYSVFFIILILNLAANPNRLFNLDYSMPDYLGKISFGLYMYHNIAIVIAIQVTRYIFPTPDSLWGQLSMYTLTFAGAIGLASLSYHAFESKFMRLKNRFSRI